MKAIWNGALGFGLVNIPVKIYSAIQDSTLDLDMLDGTDYANIKFKRVNEKTGKEVLWENIVKAYKLDDKYVILEDADFAQAMPEKTKLLAIQQFVKEEEIDSVFFEAPYYLEPQKNGESAYNLLLEALKKTGMVGVGTFVLREKELIGVIRPYQEKVLVLNRIRFSEEIRKFDELNLPAGKAVKEAELNMAISLISQLSEKFDPTAYKDNYTKELLKVIEAKAKGKNTIVRSAAKEAPDAIDLMAQLKASLAAGKKAS